MMSIELVRNDQSNTINLTSKNHTIGVSNYQHTNITITVVKMGPNIAME
jgi:hypothetical protein